MSQYKNQHTLIKSVKDIIRRFQIDIFLFSIQSDLQLRAGALDAVNHQINTSEIASDVEHNYGQQLPRNEAVAFMRNKHCLDKRANKWISGYIKEELESLQHHFGMYLSLIRAYWEIGHLLHRTDPPNLPEFFLLLEKEVNYQPAFSRDKLEACIKLIQTHSKFEEIIPLPWSYYILIFNKLDDPKGCINYVQKAFEKDWTYSELKQQLSTGDVIEEYPPLSQSKLFSNIVSKNNLAAGVTDYLEDHLKTDLLLDLLPKNEKDEEIKEELLNHLEELMKSYGFTTLDRHALLQFTFNDAIPDQDYRVDLILYHQGLECACVVELKMDGSDYEYISKTRLYMTSIDRTLEGLKMPTMGLSIYKGTDGFVANYLFQDETRPISNICYWVERAWHMKKELGENLPNTELIEKSFDKWYRDLI